QCTALPSPLTFTPANWNVAQVVTVTAVDDAAVEGPHNCTIGHTSASGDANYNAIAIANVVANVTDNDVAGVTVTESGGTTNITEGGATDTYTIVLNTAPAANVTITVTPNAQCTTAPSPLTFTPANWNVAQVVTVTAVDDAVVEGAHTCTIGHTSASGDANYNAVAIANVVANVTDNDIAGVTVTESGGTTNITEGGATDTYTIALNTIPSANVTITVTPDAQCTAAPSPLTFTPANWNVAQTVTVTAVNDLLAEGPHNCTIGHTAASGDANYNAIAIANVVANVTDNDVAGVTVTQSGGTTDVAEGGVTDTYTVVLNTAPSANVTITITPDAQCTALPSPLTFTPANWNVAQTVTVTAVDDAAPEGPHTCTITHAAASGDAAYNAIVIANVVANVADNDVPGVTVSAAAVTVAEGGGTGNYTLRLNTVPAGNVEITLTPDAQCVIVSANPVIFVAPAQGPITVTVQAVDDAVIEGAHTCTITHTITTSADANYPVGMPINNKVVNITDNDGIPPSTGGSTTVVEEVVPPQPPCADLNGETNRIVRANVQDGTVANGSVFCRIINENGSFVQSANEIGDQSVLDRGILQAVDVFGLSYTGNPVSAFNLSVNICLVGSGSIIYLDATAAPRVPVQITATSQGGYTCANIPNAGTVVLVPGPAAPAANSETASANAEAVARTPAAEVHELASCRVTTTNAVRMRTEPNTDSTIVTRLEFNVTRSADARSGNWFRVVNGGDQGWVNGDFLNWVGSCGD
ncbi:MAG: SH3 domain-containing protein, partial [Anaerolineae bacterium]|nr:SH3 domain-containing protein [Anaerolineae bacterium]